ncbi:MAG: hypothetical protein LBP87_03595 [Planctomycetaceae bacterium]|jgi:hypothetical protein|nr:hypothetical protein [Planctomycetaceae bacterium]
MKKDGLGGGNTKTGLIFEGKTDLAIFLASQTGYSIQGQDVYYNNKLVAHLFKKYELYDFLEENGVDWEQILSARLLPDNCIYVIIRNTLYIIECKFQQIPGSVDEKLQTCDFKKKQYKKLLSSLNIEVEYVYLLSNWFKAPKYKDVLDYVLSMGCHYYFEYIPLVKLGLPVPDSSGE